MSNENLNVNVSVETTLIEDFAPEMAISAKKHTLKAAYGREKRPLVFACGSDDVLRVFMNDESQQTRWSQFELTKEGEKVTAFDVIQDEASGLISIAVASMQDNKSRFRFARAVAPEKISWDIAKNDDFFHQPDLLDPSATINKIILDKQGALFASIKNDEDAKYYRIFDGKVTKYELPERGIEVKDLSLGIYKKLNGVFLLYNTKGSQTLLFQSFPSVEGGNTIAERFDCGNDFINSIAVLPNPGSDILFVGGDSLYCFYWRPGQSSPFRKKISDVSSGRKILQIKAAQDSKVQSLIVDYEVPSQTRYLAELSRQRNDENAEWPSDWSTPVTIRAKVSNFAPLSSSISVFDRDLFCISQTEELIQLRRDATSNFWTEHFVPVKALDKVRNFYSFNATVKFETPDTFSLDDQKVTLTASRAVNVTVNGINYLIGQDKLAEIELDSGNELNIIQETDNILSTLLYIEAKFLPSKVVIDLAEPLCKKLRGLKTASNFRDDSVIGEIVKQNSHLDDRSLNNLANGIQQVLDFRETLLEEVKSRSDKSSLMTHDKGLKLSDNEEEVELLAMGGAPILLIIAKLATMELEIGALAGPIGETVAMAAILITIVIVLVYAKDSAKKELPAYLEAWFESEGNEGFVTIKFGESYHRYPLKTPDEVMGVIQIILSSIGIYIPAIALWSSNPKEKTDKLYIRMYLDENRDGYVDIYTARAKKWEWGKGKLGAIVAVRIHNNNDIRRESLVLKWKREKDSSINWKARLRVNPVNQIKIYSQEGSEIKPDLENASEIYKFDEYNPFKMSVDSTPFIDGEYQFEMEAVKFPESPEETSWLVNMEFMFSHEKTHGKTEIIQNVQIRIAPWIMASDLDATELVEASSNEQQSTTNKTVITEVSDFVKTNQSQFRKASVNDTFWRDWYKSGYVVTANLRKVIRLYGLRKSDTAKFQEIINITNDTLQVKDLLIPTIDINEDSNFENGGNYLVSPPIEGYPLGRVILGGAPTSELSKITSFLKAQKIQKPIVVDTGWLAVKHIDEVISFVPIIKGSGTEGWKHKVLIASPRLAHILCLITSNYNLTKNLPEISSRASEISNNVRKKCQEKNLPANWKDEFKLSLTQDLETEFNLRLNIEPEITKIISNKEGDNSQLLDKFAGKIVFWSLKDKSYITDLVLGAENNSKIESSYYYAIDPIRYYKWEQNKNHFMEIQEKIDKIRETLKEELNISDEDFVEIPVIFSPQYSRALTANSVNMLLLNEQDKSCHCIVPKPFGPVMQGFYLFEEYIKRKLELLGLKIHFVNDWDEFHLNDGEIHCGTNQIPYLPEEGKLKWWEMNQPAPGVADRPSFPSSDPPHLESKPF